jgi:predicted nucleotidyltransferase
MSPYSFEELKSIISPIAKRHGVESVSVFGSYSRGTASAESDLDLKIEKGELRSLFQLSAFRLAVEDALNLSVDLVTSETSDKYLLEMIVKEEVLLYRSA